MHRLNHKDRMTVLIIAWIYLGVGLAVAMRAAFRNKALGFAEALEGVMWPGSAILLLCALFSRHRDEEIRNDLE